MQKSEKLLWKPNLRHMKIQYEHLFMKSRPPKTPQLYNLSMEKFVISLQLLISLCYIHSSIRGCFLTEVQLESSQYDI